MGGGQGWTESPQPIPGLRCWAVYASGDHPTTPAPCLCTARADGIIVSRTELKVPAGAPKEKIPLKIPTVGAPSTPKSAP